MHLQVTKLTLKDFTCGCAYQQRFLLQAAFFKIRHEDRVVRRLPKCIRKNSARWIQKNLRSINWYSCYELFKTGKFHIFLVSFIILVSCPKWSRSCFTTGYMIFSNITHQPALREARPNTKPFFFQGMPYKIYWRKRAICAQALISTSFDREKNRTALFDPSSNYLLPRV